MTLAQFEKKLSRKLEVFEKLLTLMETGIMENMKVYEGKYWVTGKSQYLPDDDNDFESDGRVQVLAENYEQAIDKIKAHAMSEDDGVDYESFELTSLNIVAEPEC